MPVFQDGRGRIKKEDMNAAMFGPGFYDYFHKLDNCYKFDALVIKYTEVDEMSLAKLENDCGGCDLAADRDVWALVAFDDGGMLYLKRDGKYSHLVRRDEYRFLKPDNSIASLSGDFRIREELERSVSESPDCSQCRILLGFTYLSEKNIDMAEKTFASITGSGGRRGTTLLFGLAQVATMRGDGVSAKRYRDEARKRISQLSLRKNR
jgi:hypothetical protein